MPRRSRWACHAGLVGEVSLRLARKLADDWGIKHLPVGREHASKPDACLVQCDIGLVQYACEAEEAMDYAVAPGHHCRHRPTLPKGLTRPAHWTAPGAGTGEAAAP